MFLEINNMSSNSKLKNAVKKSAEKLAKTSTEVTSVVKNMPRSKSKGSFKEHKHCKICGKSISPNVENLLCKSELCHERDDKDMKVKKQLRLWMIILVVAILSPNILQLAGIW
tara:strand:+ start:37477 stop:37815 length:339 start_codon:yes stop_codon:yes gene_type:complete